MNTCPAPSIGLIAWLENTRIALPLKGVEASFSVRGDLVSVELCQIYHQSHAQPLDVLYSFPLPGGAAVYRCEMIVNDRVIRAKVMELEEARQVAAEKKAAGHRTALVESVRENLFELALGNLAPGDTVVIRLCWFQTLDTAGHERSFRIPFTPGVRYIPGTPLLRSNSGKGTVDDTDQVPDASRLTPPRMNQFHPDAAWVSVEGRIELEGVDAAHIASPSHTLVLREHEGALTARLGGTGEVPDRDFVLRLPASSPAVLTPVAWTAHENGHCHALVRIIAPETAPASIAPRDVYFLVDRSTSMEGPKWNATCKAFRAFLGNLAPQDRAWVTFFESSFRDLAEEPLPPAAILAEKVVQTLESWPVDGGTELLPALDHVLEALQKHSAARSPVIVLITDGQVGNEATIIERMAHLPEVRVFCYGIDTAVNDAFLRRLAAQQRGACTLATPQEDLVGTIAGLAARLRHPVFTGLQPPDGWELPAGAIPDLHAGECLTVSLRGPGLPAPASLEFAAHDVNGAPATLTCPTRPATHPAPEPDETAIPRLWAKERIQFLIEQNQRTAAVELSISANLICQFTAFVAWDETERLAVAAPNREIQQPSMMPAGAAPLPAARRAPAAWSRMSLNDTETTLQVMCRQVPMPDESAGHRFSNGRVTEYYMKSGSNCDIDDLDLDLPDTPLAEPLIRRAGTSWRDGFVKFLGYANFTVTDALLDILDRWLQSDPDMLAERFKLLRSLAYTLAGDSRPLETLAAWLAANLEPAFREPALRELAAAGTPA